MRISNFGKRFRTKSGIVELMDDLGSAMRTDQEVYMLGGGNPGDIPQIVSVMQTTLAKIAEQRQSVKKLVGNYDPPQGDPDLIQKIVYLLNNNFGWKVSAENIILTSGSQSSFFLLFNIFAGDYAQNQTKKIFLPMVPEYIGYSDLGLQDDFFVSIQPQIEDLNEHCFKYHIDFSKFPDSEEVGAITVSRPTNPTGNVITNEELEKLLQKAKEWSVPIILDNAYGFPFPNVVFQDLEPIYDENIIYAMSLSKFGIPGARLGIVVAQAEVIEILRGINAITHLANGNLGPALVLPLFENNRILDLSREVVQPFYAAKRQKAIDWLMEFMPNHITWKMHKSEGAFFIWLWFPKLALSSYELYEKLKQKGVIVVPGNYFFPGLKDDWQHKDQCIRITFAQEDHVVREGIKRIGALLSSLP